MCAPLPQQHCRACRDGVLMDVQQHLREAKHHLLIVHVLGMFSITCPLCTLHGDTPGLAHRAGSAKPTNVWSLQPSEAGWQREVKPRRYSKLSQIPDRPHCSKVATIKLNTSQPSLGWGNTSQNSSCCRVMPAKALHFGLHLQSSRQLQPAHHPVPLEPHTDLCHCPLLCWLQPYLILIKHLRYCSFSVPAVLSAHLAAYLICSTSLRWAEVFILLTGRGGRPSNMSKAWSECAN